ncbi:hypothetical protein DESC_670003 [Desulfosarcina cetonica]|nr:hypothetical protein DESC_670003 [Desulfosarcina cetonica]
MMIIWITQNMKTQNKSVPNPLLVRARKTAARFKATRSESNPGYNNQNLSWTRCSVVEN